MKAFFNFLPKVWLLTLIITKGFKKYIKYKIKPVQLSKNKNKLKNQ